MTVGERVKIIAEKQGISLKELAKQANLSYNTVYSITRRGSERVAPDTISRLANALGVNVNELTADASIRVSPPVALLLLVAGARHGAVGTVAATAGFSFFLVLYQLPDDEYNNEKQYGRDQNRTDIFRDPC